MFVTSKQDIEAMVVWFTKNGNNFLMLGNLMKKYLSFSTAHKIIQKFLTEKRIISKPKPHVVEKMTTEELSKVLGIKADKLHSLNSSSKYKKATSEITLKLVSLYCQTKWE